MGEGEDIKKPAGTTTISSTTLKSDFRSSITRLKYIKLGVHYLTSNVAYLITIPIILVAASSANIKYYNDVPTVIACTSLISALAALYFMTRPRKIYLVDFSCYKPDPSLSITRELVVDRISKVIDEESGLFTKKVLERSGLGDKTYAAGNEDFPPKRKFECARNEAEMIICGAVDDLLGKTLVNPKDIGIVIVNISAYNPTPSLSSMIVNRYKLRDDVVTCNLGGMGCSAGLIAVDLAKRLLQVQPNTYALIMSLESMTANGYAGKDRSKLLGNCLFRMGGAAMLLSNRFIDKQRSKYELTRTLRTHRGADDKSYGCVFQEEDREGNLGISLSKELMSVAGEALQAHITTLGPLVLPMSEQIKFLVTLIARRALKMKKVKPYVPDFALAFDHFCIHTGGRGVLDELEKNLQLMDWHMEPSRMTLYGFGNTSSSSIWYELAYAEAKGRVKKGHRIWQVAFGSGFKCNSGVWRALKTIDPAKERNPWTDEIDQFPVVLPKIMPIRS